MADKGANAVQKALNNDELFPGTSKICDTLVALRNGELPAYLHLNNCGAFGGILHIKKEFQSSSFFFE